MTQEEKDLLLKDLCARLPYGIKVSCIDDFNHDWYNLELVDIKDSEAYISTCEPYYSNKYTNIESIRPYLFPISSMTEELKEDMIKSSVGIGSDKNVFDWYNKNHFDYRRLIPLGLAIDATGLNIY